MSNAIILHGMPSQTEYQDTSRLCEADENWLPWLRRQLQLQGIMADSPNLLRGYAPRWQDWLRAVERYDITPQTMLVGHSGGAGFWVRYLSERPDVRVGKVVLVAPWTDPDRDETGDFFDFDIDPELAGRTAGLVIFNSDNDMGNVHKTVAELRQTIRDVQYREFHKMGHFVRETMGRDAFPELLDELLDK